jgi:hypothetical protein
MADEDDNDFEEPASTQADNTRFDTFNTESNLNSFWKSDLDLRSQQRLLDTLGSYVDDPYYPYAADGRPLLTATGATIPDKYSSTGLLMSPTGDISSVVRAGQTFGLSVETSLARANVIGAAAGFVAGLGASLGTYGFFDYQRKGFPGSTPMYYSQYRDLSNFSIGVFGQQAGMSETAIARIAGLFAGLFSSNAHPGFSDPQNWMALQNREMIHLGYSLSAQGAFAQPRVP